MNQFLIASFAIFLVVYYISAYSGHDDDDHDHKRSYKYDYSVQDSHTRGVKQQHKVTHEQYALAEPDRNYRSVEYEAELHNDFDTEVKRIGRAHHNHASHHHPNPHHFDESHHTHHNNVNFRERFGEIKSPVGTTKV